MRRLIALLFFFAALRAGAEPLRITTWNLGAALAPQPDSSAEQSQLTNAAAFLKSLNADVLLLQEVRDRQTCEQLAGLLQPEGYRLAVCSAFPDFLGRNLSQVAILSRRPVASAWVEPWRPDGLVAPAGGFAFAAIREGPRFVVFYCVQLQNNRAGENSERDTQVNIFKRELSASQLVRHMTVLEAKFTNQLASIVIAGSLNTNPDDPQFVSEDTLSLLEQAGFRNAFAGAPLKSRITRRGGGTVPAATFDYLLAKHTGFSAGPKITATELSSHFPVTAELAFSTPGGAESTPPARKPAIAGQFIWVALATAFASGVALGWLLMKRKRFYSPDTTTQEDDESENGIEDGSSSRSDEPDGETNSLEKSGPGVDALSAQSERGRLCSG